MDVVGMIRRHPGRTAAVAVLGLAVAVAGFLWFRADGRRFLRFEGFETSNGPDLLVYLSSKEPSGTDDWHGYDRDFVDLGVLKGNVGSQNYRIPDGVDLDRYSTAVVWCRRVGGRFPAARPSCARPSGE